MDQINLKDEVQRIIGKQWEDFVRSHPNLAAVIDQPMLIEAMIGGIGDNAEFKQAMAQAAAGQIGADAVVDLLGRLIAKFLGGLASRLP